MTFTEIANMIEEIYPLMFRNNRGGFRDRKGRYVRFGIPLPPAGRKEKDEDPKGPDFFGAIKQNGVPIMAGIEVKTCGDRLKKGQLSFLLWIHKHGGIAELWEEGRDGKIKKTIGKDLWGLTKRFE